ncbi:MAG: iron-containing alcohol dehydrogenase [Oscillospiraceae bacterium]
MQLFNVPEKIYFMPGAVQYLEKLPELHRVVVFTDKETIGAGIYEHLKYYLERNGAAPVVDVFYDINRIADLDSVNRGVAILRNFKPDTVIALGGGNVMDTAKAAAAVFSNPDLTLDQLADKYSCNNCERKMRIVCIPTTSGSGAEITSTAVVFGQDGKKYHLVDCNIKPDVAIVDSELVFEASDEISAAHGFEVLAHGIEAFVSVMHSDYTDSFALSAIKATFDYLPRSCKNGSADHEAREKMHNAAAIAGMAYESTLCGLNSALSHSVSSATGVSKGIADAVFLPYTIEFNAAGNVSEAWPKYGKEGAAERYRQIAEYLGLDAGTPKKGVKSLVSAIKKLAKEIGVASSFESAGSDYLNKISFMAEKALEDRDMAGNPRAAVACELEEILRAAYSGK